MYWRLPRRVRRMISAPGDGAVERLRKMITSLRKRALDVWRFEAGPEGERFSDCFAGSPTELHYAAGITGAVKGYAEGKRASIPAGDPERLRGSADLVWVNALPAYRERLERGGFCTMESWAWFDLDLTPPLGTILDPSKSRSLGRDLRKARDQRRGPAPVLRQRLPQRSARWGESRRLFSRW